MPAKEEPERKKNKNFRIICHSLSNLLITSYELNNS